MTRTLPNIGRHVLSVDPETLAIEPAEPAPRHVLNVPREQIAHQPNGDRAYMSWDCYLNDPETGETLELDFKHEMAGGTYQVGGTRELKLNVTYNYGKVFRRFNGNLSLVEWLDGVSGEDAFFMLSEVIQQLKSDVSPDYWEATEGNARQALIYLRKMSGLRGYGVWRVE